MGRLHIYLLIHTINLSQHVGKYSSPMEAVIGLVSSLNPKLAPKQHSLPQSPKISPKQHTGTMVSCQPKLQQGHFETFGFSGLFQPENKQT